MEVVLRCENYVQVDALTFADFTLLVWTDSHITVGVTRRLLLSSRVSLLVINLLTIREKVRVKYLFPLIHILCVDLTFAPQQIQE